MPQTPFHALYTARELAVYATDADKLAAAFASSDIEVYPYQVAAAMFALRSPYLKGAVLADEGSMGKTYEALLVISQTLFEGKERILIIVPTPLLGQWTQIMDGCFTVPYITIDSNERFAEIGGDNPFEQTEVILTTYDFAVQKADNISRVVWNMVVFEEAHRISNHENKTTVALKEAVGEAYKLLLTATPMQNSIMDLYGLIHFIDETILGDADEFYKRYFRKPENYHELTSRVSRHIFRTLRSQVEGYVKITRRLPVSADYKLTADELRLAAMLTEYLKKPEKTAYPKMDAWELSLMLWRSLSSSTFAFDKLLQGAIEREPESELLEMQKLAAEITVNAKGQDLLKVLKKAFAELKKRGANQKALIFTENRATQQYLFKLLKDSDYNVLTYNGDKSRDYDIIRRFKNEADILITTDIAAEGFNLAFCSFVVNYDLPYNVLTLEQRIMRCHRQGQQNDVIVLNFLSKENFADTRMLELINKRVSQFDGIIGMSDDVVGNFADSAVDGLSAAFEQARHHKDIEAEFQAALTAHEETNITAVQEAENALFTTFTRDIAQKVTVTPQYIKDRTAEINKKLWEIVASLLEEYGYVTNERTANLPDETEPPQLFYYWTGSRNRPYTGLRSYGIGSDFKPASGRVTLTSPIGRGAIENAECADSGMVTAADVPKCDIAFYIVSIKEKGSRAEYNTFAGRTADGKVLDDEACRTLMNLPVDDFSEDGRRAASWLKSSTGRSKPHELDSLINIQSFKERAMSEISDARREESVNIQDRTYHQKQALNRNIAVLKNQLLQIDNALSRSSDVSERIDAEKKKAAASRELKQREQSLFMDGMRLDVEAEEAVKRLNEQANLTADVYRQFVIKFTGGQA